MISRSDRGTYQAVAFGWSPEDRKVLAHPSWKASRMRVVRTWNELRAPRPVRCARLVVAGNLDDAKLLTRLSWLRDDFPLDPLSLATRLSPENLVLLKHIVVDHVLDWEAPRAGWEQVEISTPIPVERLTLAEAARQKTGLHPLVRIGLIRLARAEPPIPTVNALADTLGYSAGTTRRHFRSLLRPWRCEDLVDWFLLHRFGWEPAPTRGSEVERRTQSAGPSRRTLDRMAMRLLGRSRRSYVAPPDPISHPMIRQILSA